VTGDDLLYGHRTVSGLALGMVIDDTTLLRSSMAKLFDWLADGRLRVLIGRKFPLAEAGAAHSWLESRQSQGKILLLP
jgi:NADPH2:quinone reductase